MYVCCGKKIINVVPMIEMSEPHIRRCTDGTFWTTYIRIRGDGQNLLLFGPSGMIQSSVLCFQISILT